MRDIRIAFWGDKEPFGSMFYRVLQPLGALDGKGYQVIHMPDKRDGSLDWVLDTCLDILSGADILFLQSASGVETMQFLEKLLTITAAERVAQKRTPLYLAVDFDDDLFNMDPYNQMYKWYGRHEVHKKDGRELRDVWTEENGFKVKENYNRLKSIVRILGMTDILFVTTERLKFKYRRYAKNIVVAPNAIDFKFLDYRNKLKVDDSLRIGWTVSQSHLKEWKQIRETMGKILKRNPNVKFTVFGECFSWGRDLPLSQIERVKWVNNHGEYCYNLTTAGLDIAICPLKDDRFNWKKSAIKWEEFSALKIPCVVSNVLYSDYVKDGVTGLVCKDLSEFDSKLQFLIDHADARRDIGNATYEDVKINYDLKKIVDIYDKAFKKLMFQNIILPQEVKR